MSVPHLDTRFINGKRSLRFGPYAGWSRKFLKHGSHTDLFRSLEAGNVVPVVAVARDHRDLLDYLIGQVLQTGGQQFRALELYYPDARREDSHEAVAGQRVQIIKPDPQHTGVLEFGTGDRALYLAVPHAQPWDRAFCEASASRRSLRTRRLAPVRFAMRRYASA
jgi:malate dehydrogenase (quinone)